MITVHGFAFVEGILNGKSVKDQTFSRLFKVNSCKYLASHFPPSLKKLNTGRKKSQSESLFYQKKNSILLKILFSN